MKDEMTTKISDKKPMHFQPRDAEILKCIHDFGGVIAKRQLQAIFWEGKTKRAMEKRLAKLHSQRFIEWPDANQRRRYPIPEPVIWLEWHGAWMVAGRSGIQVAPPSVENENQKREMHKQLIDQGFHWLREPRWSQLLHDLTIVDIRLMFQRYTSLIPHLTLEEWKNESEFRTDMDEVQIHIKGRDGRIQKRKKGICPDGFFSIIDERRRSLGQNFRARLLVEVDMATHDNASFGWEKVLPGAAYIRSKAYLERFGSNSGRWLVITTGETRMKNLMLQTSEKAKGDAGLFLFTTFEDFFLHNALVKKIWHKCGVDDTLSMFEG